MFSIFCKSVATFALVASIVCLACGSLLPGLVLVGSAATWSLLGSIDDEDELE